jgi:cyclic pyranopterin phosphate synthase
VDELSHVDASGRVRMVDVGGKPVSRRRAVARARVEMATSTAARLRDLPKGDALATAELAGVMAAKRTAELIPLCHPLGLDHVEVEASLDEAVPGVRVRAAVRTVGRTGVEMEALTAVSVALLTVYDMVKAVDAGMVIQDVQLVEKKKAPGPA